MVDLFRKIHRLPEHSEEANTLVEKCQENDWLKRGGFAWQDDPFLEDYDYQFCRAETIEDLKEFFSYGFWALRQGILYSDLAFIQQSDGGDEWWTLKKSGGGWVDFESLSCKLIINRSPEKFERMIAGMEHSTIQQCEKLDYMQEPAKSTPLSERANEARRASKDLKHSPAKENKPIER